jgi:general secretion pathway protein G
MKKYKGFTLIELLVVIAIIGLLSTLAVVALNNARAKSRDAKRVSDVKQVQTALELFFNDENSYPTNVAFTSGSTIAGPTSGITYMQKVPETVTPTDGTCSTADNTYTFSPTGTWPNVSTYTINFCLGNNTGGVDSGLNTASPAGIQ